MQKLSNTVLFPIIRCTGTIYICISISRKQRFQSKITLRTKKNVEMPGIEPGAFSILRTYSIDDDPYASKEDPDDPAGVLTISNIYNMDTDESCIGSFKSNYHTFTTTMAPHNFSNC
jgi:hypothetical protein